MIQQKIKIAIAEDKQDDRKKIISAISQTSNCELVLVATNGRQLLEKLNELPNKQLPQLILMDMQMHCSDGLLTTIVCKRLYPNIKISGLSSNTDAVVIDEFIAEGGDAFLSKEMLVKGSITHRIYKDDDIFEKSLYQIVSSNNLYFDPLLNYEQNNKGYTSLTTTKKVLAKYFKCLKENEILYLQLNAAGFTREKIAAIMNRSYDTIKLYSKNMFQLFDVDNHIDLTSICLNVGIVKFVRLYQPQLPQSFITA